MYRGNDVTTQHSPAVPQKACSLVTNNKNVLLSTGFQEIGSSGLFRKDDSYISLDTSGKIEFFAELNKDRVPSKDVPPIEICKISYRDNFPVFELQREGCKGFGIYGLTGWSQLSPSRKHPPTAAQEMPLREYLLCHNFLADSDNPDVLRYALPSKEDNMLADSVIALFKGGKLVSLLKPEHHYAAEKIGELDVLSTEFPSSFSYQNISTKVPAEPSTENREEWIAWASGHNPPWDRLPEESLEEMRTLSGLTKESEEAPSSTEPLPDAAETSSQEILFLGNHRYKVPITTRDGVDIHIGAKMYFSFPTDEELDIHPFSPIVTSSGFTIGGQNSTEDIRAITEFNGILIDVIEEDMRPGNSSLDGFLGQEESLREVLERDNTYVLSLGLTHQEIAQALERIVALATHTAHDSITVGKAEIVILGASGGMGTQESPFGDNSRGSIDVRILNARTGDTLWIPGILPHLIGLYGFYEGTGTPFRVSPEQIVKILELTPAVYTERT